jgi:DCN1-like protein 1/2
MKTNKLFIFIFHQHKLKSSQRDKVRQFIAFTQTTEKTGIHCLSCHDWKLDVAVDNYFQNPEKYNESSRPTVDRKRLEALWQRYKGEHFISFQDASFAPPDN